MFGLFKERLTTAKLGQMLAALAVRTALEENREARRREGQTAEEERDETRELCLLHAFAIDYAVVLCVKDLTIRSSLRDHLYVELNGALSWLTNPEMFYDVFRKRIARYGPAASSANTGDPSRHLFAIGTIFAEHASGKPGRVDIGIGAAHFYVEAKKLAMEFLGSALKEKIVPVGFQ
jgi:hypothetical protein